MDIIVNTNATILKPFTVVTAEILYFMPDHPVVLQSFIWQDFDHPPEFPKLRHFLEFWNKDLDGKLHSVYVTDSGYLKEYEVKHADSILTLH